MQAVSPRLPRSVPSACCQRSHMAIGERCQCVLYTNRPFVSHFATDFVYLKCKNQIQKHAHMQMGVLFVELNNLESHSGLSRVVCVKGQIALD